MNATPTPDLDGLLRSCCRAAGLDGAGVSIVDGQGAREPLYASDEVATVIERLQLTLGEGPCVDSAATGTPVLVADLTDARDAVASRWPVFRNEANTGRRQGDLRVPDPDRCDLAGRGRLLPSRHRGPLSQPAAQHCPLLGRGRGPGRAGGAQRVRRPAAPVTTNMVVHQAAGMVMGQLDSSIEEAMVRLRATAFAEGLTHQRACRRCGQRPPAHLEGDPMNNPTSRAPEHETGRDTLLAERFAMLADTLVDDYDVVDLLDRLVEHVRGAARRGRGRAAAHRPARQSPADGVLERGHATAGALPAPERGGRSVPRGGPHRLSP